MIDHQAGFFLPTELDLACPEHWYKEEKKK